MRKSKGAIGQPYQHQSSAILRAKFSIKKSITLMKHKGRSNIAATPFFFTLCKASYMKKNTQPPAKTIPHCFLWGFRDFTGYFYAIKNTYSGVFLQAFKDSPLPVNSDYVLVQEGVGAKKDLVN
jgi:hypothetical protein